LGAAVAVVAFSYVLTREGPLDQGHPSGGMVLTAFVVVVGALTVGGAVPLLLAVERAPGRNCLLGLVFGLLSGFVALPCLRLLTGAGFLLVGSGIVAACGVVSGYLYVLAGDRLLRPSAGT